MREPGFYRPTYEELYMRQAYAISLKSPCPKRQVGAVLVSEVDEKKESDEKRVEKAINSGTPERRESYVVATGFNDVPAKTLACSEFGEGRYCPKDAEIDRVLREIKYCPKCKSKLRHPTGSITKIVCPKCKTHLPKDLFPSKMLDVCIAVHAEEAAILQAAKLGSTALNGAILYTTTFPCPLCSKSIINAGIKRVVFNEPYPLDDNYRMFKKMFEQCGMALDKFEGVNAWAFDRLFRAKLV
jgi:deoxycytidylate deaminase